MLNLFVHRVTIRLLNTLCYYVMEEEVAVYRSTEKTVQLRYSVGAVAHASSNEMRTYTSARTSIGIIAKENYGLSC